MLADRRNERNRGLLWLAGITGSRVLDRGMVLPRPYTPFYFLRGRACAAALKRIDLFHRVLRYVQSRVPQQSPNLSKCPKANVLRCLVHLHCINLFGPDEFVDQLNTGLDTIDIHSWVL